MQTTTTTPTVSHDNMRFANSVASMLNDQTPAFRAGKPYLESYDEYQEQLRSWQVNFAQDPKEFKSFLADVCDLYGGGDVYDGPQAPQVYVEIGTREGGSLYLAGAHLPAYSTLISIDIAGGPWGNPKSAGKKRMIAQRLDGAMKHNVHLIDANSHEPGTFYQLLKILSGRKIDALFLDADHTYEGVRTDFQMYAPLVRPGGIVAFHDVTEMAAQRGPLEMGVPKFWDEIKSGYKHTEYVSRPNKVWGVGVLWMP